MALVLTSGANAESVRGVAAVSDGDTLRVGGQIVRLHGIDAPETRQECVRASGESFACGKWATRALRNMVEGKELACTGQEHDRYNRLIAKCFLDGHDIAVPLIEQGIAVAYRKYSMDYVGIEKGAVIAGRGLWSMKFENPGTWRVRGTSVDQSRDCNIKGNLSSGGRIYHVPGQRFYGTTTIRQSRGERWFCSEAEAERAGWRKARG